MTSKQLSSSELQNLLSRVDTCSLSADDKAALKELLSHAIDLKKLVEDAVNESGGKKVLASLPFGFDIVK